MLIEFSIGNYKSFKERVTFSMAAAKLKAKEKSLDSSNSFRVDADLILLKSAAIYGANASGKSNFVSALKLVKSLVSGRWGNEEIDVQEFKLSDKTLGKPSSFEVVFLVAGMKYRYGFEATIREIVSEWLFCTPSTKEARLFVRERGTFKISERFKEAKGLEAKTRRQSLFLAVVKQFNGPIAGIVGQWFHDMLIAAGLADQVLRDYTVQLIEKTALRDDIVQLIKQFDLNIADVEIGPEIPMAKSVNEFEDFGKLFVKKAVVNSVHLLPGTKRAKARRVIFDMDRDESEGTRKLFSLAGPIVASIELGIPLVVDEFDSRLHPIVSKAIVSLYNSRETNPHNAQLIFTTHDTNLLSNKLLRRDQIWFTEKTREGATDLYSLAEFKLPSQTKVRNDASFESDYIRGRYGAVPYIADLRPVHEKDA